MSTVIAAAPAAAVPTAGIATLLRRLHAEGLQPPESTSTYHRPVA